VAGVYEGEILAGKYRVERILGVGGMGVVVAAHHVHLDTKVAIKLLLPEMLAQPEAAVRFAREARNAVRITNEHVARVWDVGTLDNGAPYMVMEFLQGADLSSLLAQRGQLPIEEAVDFVLQGMEAIAEAHALGIVHRDLKPANLFCIRRPDGRLSIKVLDFGISKSTLPGAISQNLAMTAPAARMGSPFYMSPEQIEFAHTVDARTDIWAMGVVLFEILTGKVPFYGETISEVSFKIAARPPTALRPHRPDAPEGLERAIFTCLEKDRDRRFRNVAELALALLPFGSKRAKASVERIADTIHVAGQSTTSLAPSTIALHPSASPNTQPMRVDTMPALGRTTIGRSGGRAMTGLIALAALLAVAGGAAALRRLAVGAGAADPGLRLSGAPAASTPIEASTPAACDPGATRCVDQAMQTCVEGEWIASPVTAGQCGALCTPGTSGARCNAGTPQTCASTGRWEDRPACGKAQVCREGACVEPLPSPPRKKECDPPYYWDHGNRVFKTECI
jgi:serine/threonine-protein kinase